jgi:hypothetical protein
VRKSTPKLVIHLREKCLKSQKPLIASLSNGRASPMLDADSPMLDAGIGFRLLNHLPRTRRRDRVVVILFPVVGSEGRFLPLPFGLRR